MAPDVERCSRRNLDVPLGGTALVDARILIVEQPGPWGRDALADSALDPSIVAQAGADRVLLARHCDRPRPGARRHWWALRVADSQVHAAGGAAPWDEPLTERVWTGAASAVDPTVFLCTNGKRDACCAEFGRALLRRFPRHGDLWEVSHLSGHRFAPTALMLPSGVMLGRLDYEALAVALTGQIPEVGHLRGRVGRSPQRQTAEIAVAARTGAPVQHLRSEQVGDAVVEVAAPTASDEPWDWFQIRLQRHVGPARPKSCGAEPEPAHWWAEDSPTAPR